MANVACVGAGNVGSAWAVALAQSGHSVSLYDAAAGEADNRALLRARSTLQLLKDAGRLDEDMDAILDRICPVSTLQAAVNQADYVQESVREDIDVKRAIFREMAEAAPAHCILASSTSAIRGSQFLADIKHPERALVAHPVNPPSLIPLVELCATEHTAPSIVERTELFLEDAGMKPVRVRKEIDGFILNRLQYTLVAEAMHLVGEGYCSARDIDRVMTDGLALRWAHIGPFQVAHLNATNGFMGFVEQLGPMMKTMGQSAVTDYDWDEQLASEIHAELTQNTSVADIQKTQHERNKNILRVRKLQEEIDLDT